MGPGSGRQKNLRPKPPHPDQEAAGRSHGDGSMVFPSA